MKRNQTNQRSGEPFTFRCGHSGIFPNLGEGNDVAMWSKNRSNSRGGYWACRVCNRDRCRSRVRGSGPQGLQGWAKALFPPSMDHAHKRGYKSPQISPEKLVVLRETSKYCLDNCGQKLKWRTEYTEGRFINPHLHHDHKTGEVYGFVTPHCNSAEGHFSKIGNGDPALQIEWLKYHFPDVIERLKDLV
jgi:recombination endonuclease VII